MEKEVANALSTNYPVQNSGGSAVKWSDKINECVISISSIDTVSDEQLGSILVEGSELGQFCKIGESGVLNLTIHAGALHSGDVVLEIQGCRIPGMTRRDAVAWMRSQGKHAHPVMLKSVRSNLLPSTLGEFLQRKYPKESLDATLQQAIRDNVYTHTAACTTRARKPNEQHGVDYWFVTTAYFNELRSAGALLECGQFEGNWYGTPVPPIEEEPASSRPTDSDGVILPLTEQHLRLLRSLCSAAMRKPPQSEGEPRSRASLLRSLEHDPLPSNWDVLFDEQDRPFFVDRSSGTTQWLDPRLARTMKSDPLECADDELPYGWQRVDDPQYGTYFVDHLNRRTQYENPVLEAKRRLRDSRSNQPPPGNDNSSTASPNPRAPLAAAQRASRNNVMNNNSPAHSEYIARAPPSATPQGTPFRGAPNLSDASFKQPVGNSPEAVNYVNVVITKGLAGFGFKLASKSDARQRVKEVTDPRRCGQLRVGDVIVAVDNRDVRRITHAELVAALQSYAVNSCVSFVVERPAEAVRENNAQVATKPNLLPANGARMAHSKSIHDLRNERAAGPMAIRPELQPVAYPAPAPAPAPADRPAPAPRLRSAEHFSGSLSHGLDSVGLARQTADWTDLRMSHSALNRMDPLAARSPPPSGTGSSSATSPDLLNTTPDFIPASVLLKRSPGPRAQLSASQQNLTRVGAANLSKSFMNLNSSANDSTSASAASAMPKNTVPQASGARISLTNSASVTGSLGATVQPAFNPMSAGPGPRPGPAQLNANATAFGNQNRPPAPQNGDLLQVELGWNEAGFGFKVIGGAELFAPISIGFIEPHLAHDGRLRIGDELLAVNDVPVSSASCATVLQMLNRLAAQKQSVRLTVRRSRGDKPNAAYANQSRPQPDTPTRPLSRPSSTATSQSVTSGYASQAGNTNGVNSYSPADVVNVVLQRLAPGESFGFIMVSDIQKRIVTVARVHSDSPASRCGLQPGDRILLVNGADVNSLSHQSVVTMIKQAGASIRLTLLPVAIANGSGAGQRDSMATSVDSDMSSAPSAVSSSNANSSSNLGNHNLAHRYSLTSSSSYNVLAPPTAAEPLALRPSNTFDKLDNAVPSAALRRLANANANSNSNSPGFTVQLKRGARGFGFSVKGGYEFSGMPLQIFQIAKGGAADLDGRLQAGDEVLQINEYRTHNMTQKNAIELIQQCGPVIQITVRRSSS